MIQWQAADCFGVDPRRFCSGAGGGVLQSKSGATGALLGCEGVGKKLRFWGLWVQVRQHCCGCYRVCTSLSEGRVLLDDIDLSQISKPVLADQMGFVQQDGRLFSGTLRENLTLGMPDPGDSALLDAARSTGLLQTVITAPEWVDAGDQRGRHGLIGGQRQLVNLTRAFLRAESLVAR